MHRRRRMVGRRLRPPSESGRLCQPGCRLLRDSKVLRRRRPDVRVPKRAAGSGGLRSGAVARRVHASAPRWRSRSCAGRRRAGRRRCRHGRRRSRKLGCRLDATAGFRHTGWQPDPVRLCRVHDTGWKRRGGWNHAGSGREPVVHRPGKPEDRTHDPEGKLCRVPDHGEGANDHDRSGPEPVVHHGIQPDRPHERRGRVPGRFRRWSRRNRQDRRRRGRPSLVHPVRRRQDKPDEPHRDAR